MMARKDESYIPETLATLSGVGGAALPFISRAGNTGMGLKNPKMAYSILSSMIGGGMGAASGYGIGTLMSDAFRGEVDPVLAGTTSSGFILPSIANKIGQSVYDNAKILPVEDGKFVIDNKTRALIEDLENAHGIENLYAMADSPIPGGPKTYSSNSGKQVLDLSGITDEDIIRHEFGHMDRVKKGKSTYQLATSSPNMTMRIPEEIMADLTATQQLRKEGKPIGQYLKSALKARGGTYGLRGLAELAAVGGGLYALNREDT